MPYIPATICFLTLSGFYSKFLYVLHHAGNCIIDVQSLTLKSLASIILCRNCSQHLTFPWSRTRPLDVLSFRMFFDVDSVEVHYSDHTFRSACKTAWIARYLKAVANVLELFSILVGMGMTGMGVLCLDVIDATTDCTHAYSVRKTKKLTQPNPPEPNIHLRPSSLKQIWISLGSISWSPKELTILPWWLVPSSTFTDLQFWHRQLHSAELQVNSSV